MGSHGIITRIRYGMVGMYRESSRQVLIFCLAALSHHSEMCRNWGPGWSPFWDPAAGSGGLELAELGEKLGRNCLYLDHLGSSWIILDHPTSSSKCWLFLGLVNYHVWIHLLRGFLIAMRLWALQHVLTICQVGWSSGKTASFASRYLRLAMPG